MPLSSLYPQGNEFIDPPMIAPQYGQDLRSSLLMMDVPQEEASVRYQATATEQDKPLGISLGKLAPYAVVDVKTTEPGSFPMRYSVEVGHVIVQINGMSSYDIGVEDLKNLMAQRPLDFVLERPAPGIWGIRWYYLAPGETVVGPIETGTMRYYFLRKFLQPTSMVKAGTDGSFYPVDKVFPNLAQAFVSSLSALLHGSLPNTSAAPQERNGQNNGPTTLNLAAGRNQLAPPLRQMPQTVNSAPVPDRPISGGPATVGRSSDPAGSSPVRADGEKCPLKKVAKRKARAKQAQTNM